MIDANKKPTLEELKAFFAEREKTMRQHGKKGKPCDNPEDEYKRLYNNYKSILCRASVKEYHNRQETVWENSLNPVKKDDDKADEYGITAKDRRRYNAKFKNCPHGAQVELAYVRRMTGLNLFQIYVLQKETGLYPHPRVTEKDARIDKKRREYEGITSIIDS